MVESVEPRALDLLCLKHDFDANKVLEAIPSLQKEDVKNRIENLKTYRSTLKSLLDIPLVEQKTEAWYAMRQDLVTASDFAQALGHGKFGSVKQFLQKKVEPSTESDQAASKVNPFFKWGNMFESVAIDIYSHLNSVKVHEFGLIKHPKNNFFGASPDGISELGIMVEIKCPRKRKIDGEVPTQYYYQIQGQLDVCDLKECDYFECEFMQYTNEEEFILNFDSVDFKGIIVETTDNKYSYSDGIGVGTSVEEMIEWSNSFETYESIVYWSLDKYNNVRVIRDDDFLKVNMKALEDIWNKVRAYRKDYSLYEREVLKEIKIETQPYRKPKVAAQQASPEVVPEKMGWAFIDDPDVVKAVSKVKLAPDVPHTNDIKLSGWSFISD